MTELQRIRKLNRGKKKAQIGTTTVDCVIAATIMLKKIECVLESPFGR